MPIKDKSKQMVDVLVVGAGAPGLTLAILLSKAGLKVAIADRAFPPPPSKIKPSGRTVALLESSLNILRETCVWPGLQDHCGRLAAMRLMDDSAEGQRVIESLFPANDIGLEQFGYNVPNGLLIASLNEQTKALKALNKFESPLHDYSVDGAFALARLEDGTEIKAGLIVGADGRHSVVRNCAGISVREREYDQTAITCLIDHSGDHGNISTEFHRPAGPTAFVPLPGKQSSVVWVETREKGEVVSKASKTDFTAALQGKSQDILGKIELASNPEFWPLKTLSAKGYVADRCALVAEAAHVMSPITAQGLNLSLRDVAALAEVIVDAARLGQDIGSDQVLKGYEKLRRADIETRVLGVDGMNRIVSTNSPALKWIRRSGLKAIDMTAPLKTFAMQQGLAPQIGSGRLAQGRGL